MEVMKISLPVGSVVRGVHVKIASAFTKEGWGEAKLLPEDSRI